MRLCFDIKYRPQIESGEYKLVNEDGKPMTIKDWDTGYGRWPVLALDALGMASSYNNEGYGTYGGRLFIDVEPWQYKRDPYEDILCRRYLQVLQDCSEIDCLRWAVSDAQALRQATKDLALTLLPDDIKYQQGYDEGYSQGHQKGFEQGIASGTKSGYDKGRKDGYAEARISLEKIYEKGYKEGLVQGRQEGAALAKRECRDMIGALGNIEPAAPKTYVYGLRGIQQMFNVSHKTAQAWKNTWLAPACMQHGKTIVVDQDLAMELFNKKKDK